MTQAVDSTNILVVHPSVAAKIRERADRARQNKAPERRLFRHRRRGASRLELFNVMGGHEDHARAV